MLLEGSITVSTVSVEVILKFASALTQTIFFITFLETPTQVFYCEFCETFKNTYFEKYLRITTSVFFYYLYRREFRTLSNIYVGMSCKNNSWLLTFSYFRQQLICLFDLSKNELSIPMQTVCHIQNKVEITIVSGFRQTNHA